MSDAFYLDTLMQALEDVFEHRRAKPSHTVYKAVLFELVVIGEMASRLSKGARELEAEIPWHRVVSVRNRLVHAPYNIDHYSLLSLMRSYRRFPGYFKRAG